VTPFGRAGKRSSVALHLLARTGPLPARRALRPTTSQLAESVIIMLKEYLEIVAGKEGKHIKTIIGNSDGVFPLRRQAAVPGQDRPAIGE